jgi:hypothetical protein
MPRTTVGDIGIDSVPGTADLTVASPMTLAELGEGKDYCQTSWGIEGPLRPRSAVQLLH